MPLSQLPALLSAWLPGIISAFDCRSTPRLLLLLVGALFAKGRRTVTSWFRAAGITTEFRPAYNALWATGRHADALAYRLLCLALKPPTYGKERNDLAKRPAQKRSWQQVACVQYGERVVKTIKMFEATWRPAGSRIRVMIAWGGRRLDGLLLHRSSCAGSGDSGSDGRPRRHRAVV